MTTDDKKTSQLQRFYLCKTNLAGKRDLFQLFPDEIDRGDDFERDIQEVCQLRPI
jgi:hypothetical protein